jgi:hypothetical protein
MTLRSIISARPERLEDRLWSGNAKHLSSRASSRVAPSGNGGAFLCGVEGPDSNDGAAGAFWRGQCLRHPMWRS